MSTSVIDRRAGSATRFVGTIGAGLLVIAGILCLTTGVHDTFSGDTSDAVVETIWAVALLLSPVALSSATLGLRAGARTTGQLMLVGQAAIAAAVLATVVAGHEVWDAVYVVGFAIAIVGTLAYAVLTRRWLVLLLAPALVLALDFFTAGGPILLGLAWLLVDRARFLRSSDLPSR